MHKRMSGRAAAGACCRVSAATIALSLSVPLEELAV